MTVRLDETAEEDTERIVRKLDCDSPGTGRDFLVELEIALRLIGESPHLYSPTEDGPPSIELREYLIRRFGYRVIYSVADNEVIVRVISHTSRKPGWWKRRIDRSK